MKNKKYGSLPGVFLIICLGVFGLIRSIKLESIWRIAGSSIVLLIFSVMFVVFYKKLKKQEIN